MITGLITTVICGLAIGIERELKGKPSGIKTSIFICLASYVYTRIGLEFEDPSRVISAILGGVGFIGSGVIILSRDKGNGLTSASIIWLTSSLGILCGMGFNKEASVLTALVVGIDIIATKLKGKFNDRKN